MSKDDVDEIYLAEVRQELLDQGCDEMFVECVLDDLRDGESVTVYTERTRAREPDDE